MSQAWSGVIMALDNILALFLLPLFGAISDRCTSRRGRRTPFIVVGTLIAAVLLIALSFVDSTQDGEMVTNPDYTNYVVPARQACAWQATAESPTTLVFSIVLLLMILVSMAVFRSPAVALMPDVTLKPLRSKANAVINLMGSAGGILVLILGMVFATSAVHNSLMSYTGYFGIIAAVMLAALVVFMLTVREPEWAAEMREQSVALRSSRWCSSC